MEKGTRVEYKSYRHGQISGETEYGTIKEVNNDPDIGRYFIIKPDNIKDYDRIVRTPQEIVKILPNGD